ncbi:MAG: mandelate racemase/muconate lactonizing enzyme family protein [Verrucomicrobia bacterium]|nr:mandelate racemase/muconate lactonizing enzyme family protein [Verrucomicrobiota bacterium]MDA1066558.1 mandelate racemase/muconate lactonizing enzyme family protein [Verrucomicrobiota bacterium]
MNYSRRQIIKLGALSGMGCLVASELSVLADEQDRIRSGKKSDLIITNAEQFVVDVRDEGEEIRRGEVRRHFVYKISTNSGITGYSFGRGHPLEDLPRVREILFGKDPFAVDQFLAGGLCQVGSWEHAVWDVQGKALDMPVHRLLGGAVRDKIRVYLTIVWPGKDDQSDVSYERQAEDIKFFQDRGFKGVKIRCWRPQIMDDVEALKEIRRAVGPDFPIMFDRTGQRAPWVWSYDEALKVARGMEEHGAYWIEEPFERENYTSSFRDLLPLEQSPSFQSISRSAKLRQEVGLRITGGEGDNDTRLFAQYLAHDAFDILQPDVILAGGILVCKQISDMVRAFDKPVRMVPHGIHGLPLAGFLQVAAFSPTTNWQELVMTSPGMLPEETLAPGKRLLKNKDVFRVEDGLMSIPQGPGLGLEVDEAALDHYRVRSEKGSSR